MRYDDDYYSRHDDDYYYRRPKTGLGFALILLIIIFVFIVKSGALNQNDDVNYIITPISNVSMPQIAPTVKVEFQFDEPQSQNSAMPHITQEPSQQQQSVNSVPATPFYGSGDSNSDNTQMPQEPQRPKP